MSRLGAYFRRLVLVVWLLAAAGVACADELPDPDTYRGKVLVLDFWASWCVPCRRSFPWFNQMHEKYGPDGLVIVAVNLDADRSAAESFLENYPPKFTIAFDPEATLARRYNVQTMPSSIVFGRDGQVREHHHGFRVKREAEYEAAIVAALQER